MDNRKNCLENSFEKDPEFYNFAKALYKEEYFSGDGITFNRFCNRYFEDLELWYQKKRETEPYQKEKDAYVEALIESDPDFFESFDGYGGDD